MSKFISVIIPTCGREDELARAIASVESQTLKIALDVVVVNDNPPGSTLFARTRTMIEERFPGVRQLTNDLGRGGAGARNCGILAAAADWVAFLDDDDEWLPEKLEQQWPAALAAPPDVAAIDTGFWDVDERAGKKRAELPQLQGWIFEDLLVKHRGRAPKLSTLICRRSALLEVGMFDEAMPSRQDLDLYLRLARHYKFASIMEPLAIKHVHAGQRISADRAKKIRGFELFYSKYKDDLSIRPALHRQFLRHQALWCCSDRRFFSAGMLFARSWLV